MSTAVPPRTPECYSGAAADTLASFMGAAMSVAPWFAGRPHRQRTPEKPPKRRDKALRDKAKAKKRARRRNR